MIKKELTTENAQGQQIVNTYYCYNQDEIEYLKECLLRCLIINKSVLDSVQNTNFDYIIKKDFLKKFNIDIKIENLNLEILIHEINNI